MGNFCDYLKEIEMACSTCTENGLGACTVRLGEQKYYEKFKINDTIHIIRHDHSLTIETDIEVMYKTAYPYGRQAGKGPEFATEYAGKEKRMRDFISPKLPTGASILPSHLHYFPDAHDPDVVALHIHVHKRVEDLDEAKHVATKMIEAIQPSEIEPTLKD